MQQIRTAGIAKQAVGSAFESVVKAFVDGLTAAMKGLLTFWTAVPTPDVGDGGSGQAIGAVAQLQQWTSPLLFGAAVLGLVVGGARLALSARGGESARDIARGLLLMVLVTAAGAGIVQTMLAASDRFSQYVLDKAGMDGAGFGDKVTAATAIGTQIAAPGLIFLLALFGIIAALGQVMLMVARGAILVVLMGVVPVAAGSSMTDLGFTWFKKLWGWMFAWVLYAPAAALVYAAAFSLLDTSKDLTGVISGYMMIVLAVLALPALLRLIPPVVMAGGGGGGVAAAAGMAATGAMLLGGRGHKGSAPPATHTPGLNQGSPAALTQGAAALPAGGGSGGGGPSGGLRSGGRGGGPGAGGAGAQGPGAGAGGPAGQGPKAGGTPGGGAVAAGSREAGAAGRWDRGRRRCGCWRGWCGGGAGGSGGAGRRAGVGSRTVGREQGDGGRDG